MKVGIAILSHGWGPMRIHLKIALVSAFCIITSGLMVSYKSFELASKNRETYELEGALEISKASTQTLEQKLTQLEAAVSYLDKSSVESMKRFGSRYFAYAYKKDDEWSIKWKVLGDMNKEAILSEVGAIDFAKLSQDKRSWLHSKSKDLIYIAPVALSDSHQLKSGFLVFGMATDFFSFLKKEDYQLVDASQQLIFGKASVDLSQLDLRAQTSILGDEETSQKVVSHFSEWAQLWVVRVSTQAQQSFVGSVFFTYFLLAVSIALMFFFLVARFILGQTQKRHAGRIQEIEEQQAVEASLPIENEEWISDLGLWIQGVLLEEEERLEKMQVSLKTQFEEGARVITSPGAVKGLLKRLVGNSVLSLENETEKEIQLQLVEQADSFQLIYVDSRTQHFPDSDAGSDIDGILSDARSLFGEALTVAKAGFCLSINLPKDLEVISEPQPALENLERIEIMEDDTDVEIFNELHLHGDTRSSNEASKGDEQEEPGVSFDQFIEQFQMKSFNFSETSESKESGQDSDGVKTYAESVEKVEMVEETSLELTKSEVADSERSESLAIEASVTESSEEQPVLIDESSDLVELKGSQFKLKIRSPKKRDTDVNS